MLALIERISIQAVALAAQVEFDLA